MATLNATNLKHASSGSNNIVLAADGSTTISGNATCSGTATGFGGGKLLQTIMVEKTDTTSHNDTTTIHDISGMTVSITPSASTSKILVTSTLQAVTVAGEYSFALYLMRDTTYLSRGNADGSNRTRATFGGLSDSSNNYDLRPFTISYLDSPNTTSTVTYKWRWNNPSHNQVIYLNRPYNYADGGYTVLTSSNIIVQEIGA